MGRAKCADCHFRAHLDGTCANKDCARYCGAWWKRNWKAQLIQRALGEVADRFGDFVEGACVASLSHRHDVRAGMAAGALLRERIASTTLRLEILCVVRLCYYWKWQAAGFLRSLLRRAGKLQGADARGRASLYERAWAEAAAALPAADFFVVCHRGRRTAELWPHAQVRALGQRPAEDQFVYRLEEPPLRCRAGSVELAALMEDMQSGRLEGALFKLAQAFAAPGATYSACDAHLQSAGLWKNAALSRALLPWLFKAEGVTAAMCAEDWALLAGITNSGAETGVDEAAGGLTYGGAVAACEAVSKHVWAAASGASSSYGLDDLACFLRLSQRGEAVGSKIVPPPPAPIDVASDLGEMMSSLKKETVRSGEAPELPAAGTSAGSGAAASSGARRLARPAWRARVLKKKKEIHAADAPRRPVPWARVLARVVLETVMDMLPPRDQVAMSRTARAQQERCLAVARRWGPARWNSVRSLVARALRADQPVWKEPLAAASAVRVEDLLRVLGRALGIVNALQAAGPLPADAPPLAMALVREALRSEIRGCVEEMLRDDFVAGGRLHVPGVGEVEAILTN